MMNRSGGVGQFWTLAGPLLAQPGVARSTMMGYPCLRLHGDFFASWDDRADHLVVKLDEETVRSLIGTGDGLVFAPAGRPFREWVALPAIHRDSWTEALRDAYQQAYDGRPEPDPILKDGIPEPRRPRTGVGKHNEGLTRWFWGRRTSLRISGVQLRASSISLRFSRSL